MLCCRSCYAIDLQAGSRDRAKRVYFGISHAVFSCFGTELRTLVPCLIAEVPHVGSIYVSVLATRFLGSW